MTTPKENLLINCRPSFYFCFSGCRSNCQNFNSDSISVKDYTCNSLLQNPQWIKSHSQKRNCMLLRNWHLTSVFSTSTVRPCEILGVVNAIKTPHHLHNEQSQFSSSYDSLVHWLGESTVNSTNQFYDDFHEPLSSNLRIKSVAIFFLLAKQQHCYTHIFGIDTLKVFNQKLL